jgi:alpha-amylase
VWEPQLPGSLATEGLEYAIVDDAHFKVLGFREEQLFGYYLTEDQGFTVAIFPTQKKLRYVIPFGSVEEIQSLLKKWSKFGSNPVAVMGDDGEKFGVWPGTHQRVYKDRWLERFFTMLSETPGVATATFSEILDRQPPEGIVYLPMCSYEELLEWQYPCETALAMGRLQEQLSGMVDLSPLEPFFRGGMWRNFLVKYPEANRLHKRMWRVSDKIAALRPRGQRQKRLVDQATESLHRGQCNDGYWHGIFGGLYLPHLRAGLYQALIKAETIADQLRRGNGPWIEVEVVDFDKDGRKEVLVSSPTLGLVIHPCRGGIISDLDYRPLSFNCINSFQRRPEAYHEKLLKPDERQGDHKGQAKTIHERALHADSDIGQALCYDWYPRGCFCDHVLDHGIKQEDYRRANFEPLVRLCPEPYKVVVEEKNDAVQVSLSRESPSSDHRTFLKVEKEFVLEPRGNTIQATYRLTNIGRKILDGRFAVEWNFCLLAGHAPDRYYLADGVKPAESHLASVGEIAEVGRMDLVDDFQGLTISIMIDPPTLWWRFPVETVSQSEYGVERVYQTSALVALWPISLEPGDVREFRGEILLASHRD